MREVLKPCVDQEIFCISEASYLYMWGLIWWNWLVTLADNSISQIFLDQKIFCLKCEKLWLNFSLNFFYRWVVGCTELVCWNRLGAFWKIGAWVKFRFLFRYYFHLKKRLFGLSRERDDFLFVTSPVETKGNTSSYSYYFRYTVSVMFF